jgi:hypothetical protein
MALPSSELTSWMAYFDLYPMDDIKDDVRNALLRSTILHASPRQFKPIGLEQLIPSWDLKAKPPPGVNLAQRMAAGLKNLKAQIGK